KYLAHYLGWRRALTSINTLTADRLANKILEFIHFQPLKAT
ncbi:IS1595 family transposase, partial [Salinisphaera sp. G21_0]|nr:IS1595 family transposase [Salinisphaera sp. G21_0]